jgi:hypothetical protein
VVDLTSTPILSCLHDGEQSPTGFEPQTKFSLPTAWPIRVNLFAPFSNGSGILRKFICPDLPANYFLLTPHREYSNLFYYFR